MSLTASNLSVTYPNGVEALRDVSLTLAAGEVVAIVGPSGCGKSTLLRVLAGLLRPTRGTIKSAGRIGLMFQDPALLPWRTVAQNVALPLELGPNPRPDAVAVDALLKAVGLEGFADAYPAELSGGMAQRAALARSLVTRPDVLLLDEPFGALDAITREHLCAHVSQLLRARGTAVVLVTHSIREAVFFADRVLVMSARPGRLIRDLPVTLPMPRAWQMEHDLPAFGTAAAGVRAALTL